MTTYEKLHLAVFILFGIIGLWIVYRVGKRMQP